MTILDRYIARHFLIGYCISFAVLIGLRIIIDLFVNLDEFTELTNHGTFTVLYNILNYYAVQTALYFRDFAGIIIVVAAAFSLGKMVKNNELVAVMASGVSLKRVIMPIVVLSLLFTGVLVIDQEMIIPPLATELVRGHDSLPGQEEYDLWFMTDDTGSLICSLRFEVETASMVYPTIITRTKKTDSLSWDVTGRITAEKAVYNFQTEQWDLVNGKFAEKGTVKAPEPIAAYKSDLIPKDIPVRQKSRNTALLSSRQLAALAAQKTKIRDQAELFSQKHFRITDPVMNMVMLLISLPVLVCRDPKAMKSAVMFSFAITTSCFIITFACKMMAGEVIFDHVIPEFWAWLPVIIFLPISFLVLDSMKT